MCIYAISDVLHPFPLFQELADEHDLGSCAARRGVRVPPPGSLHIFKALALVKQFINLGKVK